MSQARRQTDIKEIIIHCSATPNGKFFCAADINNWHKDRGFKRDLSVAPHYHPEFKYIGYHSVIRVDGVVEDGRYLLEIGAHCKGHNAISVGLCLIGTDQFSTQQWLGLEKLVKRYQALAPFSKVLGHRDTSPDLNGDGKIESNEFIKTCPGFSVADWLAGGKKPLAGHTLDV